MSKFPDALKLYPYLLFFILSFANSKLMAQSEATDLSQESLTDAGAADQTKAQDKAKSVTPAKKSGPGNVLDFEGEVIEGERRRPDLFLQMSIDNVKFDSLIYQRDDFNDYLDVDRKSRTRYLKLK